jgi:hypothetical protein
VPYKGIGTGYLPAPQQAPAASNSNSSQSGNVHEYEAIAQQYRVQKAADPLSESAAQYESEWWNSITTVLEAQEGEGERMVREMEERAKRLQLLQMNSESQKHQTLLHQQHKVI